MSTPRHQLADTLTKGNFTRDEWNNLLRLFNTSHFSSICCIQNFSSTGFPETMAKRMQEEKGEERIVAKSKPTLNLVSHAATSSSTVQGPIASKSPEKLRATCQHDWKSTGRPVAREHNQDAASSSQVWQKDEKWTRVRGDSWRRRRTGNFRISMTISINLLPTFRILRKFSRVWDRWNGESRCDCGHMENACVRYWSGCSSS